MVSKATAQLASGVTNKVKAVVLFGNPNGFAPVPNISNDKVKIYCALGDTICLGTAIVLPPHLSYGVDAGDAANFVKTKIAL